VTSFAHDFEPTLLTAILSGFVCIPDLRNRFLRARSRLGVSQEELASLLGVPKVAITQVERGHRTRSSERRALFARFIYWSESRKVEAA
jgi:ribosome-binding protein aMBF1 (putative translation factor)